MRVFANYPTRALTVLELLIVIGCLSILAALLLPALARPKSNVNRGRCIYNLKGIGLSFRTWALDNRDKYPMQVSVTNGGTMELVSRGIAFPHFLVMSNELSTPKVLVCPEEIDSKVIAASTFAQIVPGNFSNTIPFTNDNNLSYFVGVDADPSQPAALLSGDKNLMINNAAAIHGLQSIGTNTAVEWLRPRHNGGGNICLADGSVQQVDSKGLRALLLSSGVVTNRLAIP